MSITRRQFLKRGAAAAAGAAAGPHLNWLPGTNVSYAAGPSDAIVVFVQLFGGNDGVNTVYPLSGPQRSVYESYRPTLALPDTVGGLQTYPTGNLKTTFGLGDNILDLGLDSNGSNYALNPAMESWHDIYNDGELAVLPGVHYPFADYSHFRSEAIYYSGDPIGNGGIGWFGKYLDHAGFSALDVPGVNMRGDYIPLFTPTQTSLFAFRSFSELNFPASGDVVAKKAAYRALAEQSALVDGGLFPELATIGGTAVATADKIEEYYISGSGLANAGKAEALMVAGDDYNYSRNNPLVYDSDLNPATNPRIDGMRLARDLRHVAATIRADVGARFFHVGIGGFDNHSNQEQDLFHSRLLREVSESVGAFWRDMKSSVTLPAGYNDYLTGPLSDRVLIVSLSEFGRTNQQNAQGASSAGTDHATAGPQFVIGSTVNGGMYGPYPLLDDPHPDRSEDDLLMTHDFRNMYGEMLERWLSVPTNVVDPNQGGTMFAATAVADEFGDDWQQYTPIGYLPV